MTKVSAAKNQSIRTAILQMLKHDYPNAFDLKALLFAMADMGFHMSDDELEAQLKYLEEKHLVRVERRKGFGFSIAFATLTAHGVDLLEGRINETGVDI